MIETINGKAYLKVGDKVYELGGGSNIITADSVEQLPDPASVPEGTIAFVPAEESAGGGGLPTIEFTTVITEGATLTETEISALGAVKEAGTLFVAKMTIALGEQLVPVQSPVDALTGLDIMEVGFTGLQYVALIMGGAIGVLFSNIDEGWVVNMLA